MTRLIPVLAFLVLVPLIRAAETTAPTTAPYRDAIAIVHQIEGTPDAGLVDPDAPLDDRTAKFLQKNQQLFALMHQAAFEDQPEWMQSTNDMNQLLHELNPIRSLANLGVLRAKWLMQQNQPDQAVQQLLDVLALGRNVDRIDQTLVASLVSIGVEEMAMKQLAVILPALPKEVITSLPDRLKELPPTTTFADLIQGEQNFGGGMLAQQVPAPEATKSFDAMKPFYDAMKKASEASPPLSAADFKTKINDAISTIQNDPVAATLATNMAKSFSGFYNAYCTRRAHRAMLDAGILALRDGDGAISSCKDPFGDRPFGLTKLPNGFVIHSQLTDRQDHPVTMQFGKSE